MPYSGPSLSDVHFFQVPGQNAVTQAPQSDPETEPNTNTDAKAIAILGAREGFAIDFLNGRMVVNDNVTPANSFDGDPEAKLVKFGADPYQYTSGKGLMFDTARDFGVSVPITSLPYDNTAIHVYAKYRFTAPTASDFRYLLSVQHGGNNRFAFYSQTGQDYPRWAMGDGTNLYAPNSSGDILIVADTEYEVFFGADANGVSWYWNHDSSDVEQVDEDYADISISAMVADASATSGFIGIGGKGNAVDDLLNGHIAELAVIFENLDRADRQTTSPFQ